jgi:hypothetical protein
MPVSSPAVETLETADAIALATLRRNVAVCEWRAAGGAGQLRRGQLILAGTCKFREAWARDCAFALDEHLRLGMFEAARDTLAAFYDGQRPDGLFPRKIGGGNAARNLRMMISERFGWLQAARDEAAPSADEPPMQARHEHLTAGPRLLWRRGEPKDVNSLVLSMTTSYSRAVEGSFADERREPIARALAYLERHCAQGERGEHGLLYQGAHECWADHNNHRGHGLYSNLLYLRALGDAAGLFDAWGDDREAARLRGRAAQVREGLEAFWDWERGHFVKLIDGPRRDTRFSVPDNMLALEAGLATRAQRQAVVRKLEEVVRERGYVPIHAPGYPWWAVPAARLPFVREYVTGELLLPWIQLLAAGAVHPDHPALAEELLQDVARQMVRHGAVEALDANFERLGHWYTSGAETGFTWTSGAFRAAYRRIHAESRPAEASA